MNEMLTIDHLAVKSMAHGTKLDLDCSVQERMSIANDPAK